MFDSHQIVIIFYHGCIVYHNLPYYVVNSLHRIQKSSARLVMHKFAGKEDILQLNWLLVKERI